jgi:hypothetical protein
LISSHLSLGEVSSCLSLFLKYELTKQPDDDLEWKLKRREG